MSQMHFAMFNTTVEVNCKSVYLYENQILNILLIFIYDIILVRLINQKNAKPKPKTNK